MTRRLAYDIAERAAWTAIQAGLAVLLADTTGMVDVGTLRAAGLAAVAAALSVIKGAAASRLGGQTAATLPKSGG